MNNNNNLGALPFEVLINICSYVQRGDLPQVAVANRNINLAANQVLNRRVLFIDGRVEDGEVVENFTGEHVEKIVLVGRTRRQTRMPFRHDFQIDMLFEACPNLRGLHIHHIDPLQVLRSMVFSTNRSTHLKVINVDWTTCRAGNVVRSMFYGANYNHRASITSIWLPAQRFPREITFLTKNEQEPTRTVEFAVFINFFPNLQSLHLR